MKYIKKVKLHNFKKFKTLSVDFSEQINILIGDNESGKSTIIEAINLVLSGSRNKVETLGLENLFNASVVIDFMASAKEYENMPTLVIELYFNEQDCYELSGNNNSDGVVSDGLKLEIIPNDETSKDIKDILSRPDSIFPFEFYSIKFSTFAAQTYSGYKKYIRHILIDNSQISSEYAIREYVKNMYQASADVMEKNIHQNEYRKHKEAYKNNILSDLNTRITDYDFSLRNNAKSNLETDLILTENSISIENKGKGKQCFIKTKFALSRTEDNLDVVLLEEPENHLSHTNMKKLISEIIGSNQKQIIISSHNSLISTRLNLRNAILLNSNSEEPMNLNSLSAETAKFFMKAPDNNILEFILSKKVILVEGDAEFILMESFYKKVTNEELNISDIHIISVGGTSFKRYLEIAKNLNIKTAVIRDNDGDYQKNCVEDYSDYGSFDFIEIFSETDPNLSTFEISMYRNNSEICDELFLPGRIRLNAQEYMLENKTESAFQLLDKKSDSIIVPDYIREAIEWINE